MTTTDLSIVNPLVSLGGEIPGFISSRLMAAYKLDNEHTVHVNRLSRDGHRVTWSYVLERNGVVIFEADDFSTAAGTTYGEAAQGLLGFLTLQEGDTDAEYFSGYTPEQIAWRDECAEDLSLFGMEVDD